MMDFVLLILVVGMVVSIWVVIARLRSKHASDDEVRGRMPRSSRGRRRRSVRD